MSRGAQVQRTVKRRGCCGGGALVLAKPPATTGRSLLQPFCLAGFDIKPLFPEVFQDSGTKDFPLERFERPLESIVLTENNFSQSGLRMYGTGGHGPSPSRGGRIPGFACRSSRGGGPRLVWICRVARPEIPRGHRHQRRLRLPGSNITQEQLLSIHDQPPLQL